MNQSPATMSWKKCLVAFAAICSLLSLMYLHLQYLVQFNRGFPSKEWNAIGVVVIWSLLVYLYRSFQLTLASRTLLLSMLVTFLFFTVRFTLGTGKIEDPSLIEFLVIAFVLGCILGVITSALIAIAELIQFLIRGPMKRQFEK